MRPLEELQEILAGARLSRGRRTRLEQLVGQLESKAEQMQASAAYWHRQTERARAVQADRERYIRLLERGRTAS